MSFFSSVRSWLETKANPANRALIVMGLSGPIFTQGNFSQLAREGYTLNADVYACINEITRAAKGIKWKLYSGTGATRKPVEDHELLDLMQRPNPKTGWGAWFEQYIGYLEMAGNSYVVRNGPTGKPPTELWTLRPDRMTIEKGTILEPVSSYTYSAGGTRVQMLPDSQGQIVMHTKFFHPLDDWYGMSPLLAAARNVDMSNEMQKWNVSLMQNAARPSGALVTDKELAPEQFDRLKGSLIEKYTGSQNSGKPMLLEGGVTWQKLSLTPQELDWLAGDERATRKICSAFGVPMELIGVMPQGGGMNDSTFEQSRTKFYLETILPLMDFVRDEFNCWLTPLFDDGIFLDYDRDDIEAIQEERDIIYTRNNNAVKSSWMMINEARVKAGLPAIPGGDVFLLPSMVQMVDENGTIVSAPPPKAAPAPAPAPKKVPAAKGSIEPLQRMIASADHVAGLLQ